MNKVDLRSVLPDLREGSENTKFLLFSVNNIFKISAQGHEQVSVVMWLAPWPPVRETQVQIPEQHGNLVKFILVWVFFNPSGILTQP